MEKGTEPTDYEENSRPKSSAINAGGQTVKSIIDHHEKFEHVQSE